MNGGADADPNAGILWKPETLREILPEEGRFYRYAPSVMRDGRRERLWMCRNQDDGVIKDSLFYTERVDGKTVADRVVFTASEGSGWDSFHVCDPSVVAGRFRWKGVRYRYALFYLGNDVNASRHNQVGVAFATDPAGPWTRLPDPIVAHTDRQAWGAGQPSAVSVNRQGRVLLFYTVGDREGTRVLRRDIDLGDGDRPAVGPAVAVTNAGLTARDGRPDFLNNADFAYSPGWDRFFVVREQRPLPADHPQYIGASVQIASIAARHVWKGGGAWRPEGVIGSDLTGLARCHNAGLERDPYGALPRADRLRVVFAGSRSGPGVAEWTYRLWEIEGRLRNRAVRQ